MAASFTIKQGDTLPILTDTLTYSNGTAVDLVGATVALVMRSVSSSSPVTLTGSTSVTNGVAGQVQYAFSAADTQSVGTFQAVWQVTFADALTQQFPTVGYIEIEVQADLTTVGGQLLVSLGAAKDYLNIPSTDYSNDAKLLRFIQSCQAPIEAITGPILVREFEEWHDGGNPWITVHRRPSTALGCTPVFNVLACSEYNGPIEWPLAIIASPDEGQLYSVQADLRYGRIVRRTAGGGVQPFPDMPQSVHVFYEAGQTTVPSNVYEATLELVRIHYQRTQEQTSLRLGGAGFGEADDDETQRVPIGFFIPNGIRERLVPNRRYPSLA